MKTTSLTILFLATTSNLLIAQPPREGGREGGRDGGRPEGQVENSVVRLMAFDKNADGKLEATELADSRLRPLLDRADANKDKIVTKDELTHLFAKEAQSQQNAGGGGRGGRGGFGGPGDPGGRGPEGPGGMRPGQVLPEFMQAELQLKDEQRAALAKLQATVDSELAKILTADQQEHLKRMGRGPRGGHHEGPEGDHGPEGGRRPDGNRRPDDSGRPDGNRRPDSE